MNWTRLRFAEEKTVDLKSWTLVKEGVQKVSHLMLGSVRK